MGLLSLFDFRGRRRAGKLYDEARELVDDGAYEDALAIARKLRKLRYSGAYEIEGLAYSRLGRNEDAVRVLREGLALAPAVWLNWLLLGSCLSNLGRFDEALLAYDRAHACEDADRDAVALNRAIVCSRAGDHPAALRHLDSLTGYEDQAMRFRAVGTRVDALHKLGRTAEAEDLGLRTQREWLDREETAGTVDIGEIALVLGEIGLARGDDPKALRETAIAWWRRTEHERLLWLIRELQPTRSPAAQYFRLLLHGAIAPGSALAELGQGFFTPAHVVADSPEEAFALYLDLVEPEPGVELTVKEANPVEPRPDGIKGVYMAAAGRAVYEETK